MFYYQRYCMIVPQSIKEINGIGVTTNSGTNLAAENYITYTANYIMIKLELKSRVNNTHCSEERHTSEDKAQDRKESENK